MTNCNCKCTGRFDCTALAIIASIIIGIVTGILRYLAVIALPTVFLWVTFGIALGFLLVLFICALVRKRRETDLCMCSTLRLLLIGILITLLASVVLLGISFAATSVIGAIIAGVLLAAFSLIFTSVACFVRCNADCNHE